MVLAEGYKKVIGCEGWLSFVHFSDFLVFVGCVGVVCWWYFSGLEIRRLIGNI